MDLKEPIFLAKVLFVLYHTFTSNKSRKRTKCSRVVTHYIFALMIKTAIHLYIFDSVSFQMSQTEFYQSI